MRSAVVAAVVVGLVAMVSPAWGGGGFYWMLPPESATQPVSRWQRGEAFDTAVACRVHRDVEIKAYLSFVRWTREQAIEHIEKADRFAQLYRELAEIRSANLTRMEASKCLASDDPALAPRR